ncbi:hypothetical protein [Eleftheria terrae]|nr:hypothetical protein [Eleftheria terrae]WKB53006.1 hypothetical protein N7L95_00965 [Eleftheria terrae]
MNWIVIAGLGVAGLLCAIWIAALVVSAIRLDQIMRAACPARQTKEGRA